MHTVCACACVCNGVRVCVLACRCDTMDKLRKRCETLEGEIREQQKFKSFYQFTFNFAKNPGQKCLGMYARTYIHVQGQL